MFQTEPIHFLQSFASGWLTALMMFVTSLGYAPFYVVFLSLVTLGVSFRKGFLLIHMVLWTTIVTECLKNIIAFPRPSDVDSTVRLFGQNLPNRLPFTSGGATSFFGLPDPEVIDFFRSRPDRSFGFPSGHVSAATALWGGMSSLFRNSFVWSLAVAIMVLMPLSRMYLGRHFLADVLGGLVLGALAVVAVHVSFIRQETRGRLLDAVRLQFTKSARTAALLIFLLVLPLIVLALYPLAEPDHAGHLFGLNIGFLLIAVRGLPDDAGTLAKRTGRVLLGPLLYFATEFIVDRTIELSRLNEDGLWIEFAAAAFPTLLLIWGTVRLSHWFGLYGP